MKYIWTVLVIITIIIVSLSTQIRSQDESEEISEDQFGGVFGAGVNCPPGVSNAFYDCKHEANTFLNASDGKESTRQQVCGYHNYAVKCSGILIDCKSQKAHVIKLLSSEFVKMQTGLYYGCKALQLQHAPLFAGRRCWQEQPIFDCIKGTSRGVSSTVDYTAKETLFAQHCRNRNVLMDCFSNLVDSCSTLFSRNDRAAWVRVSRKAYVRFHCDELEQDAGSGSNSVSDSNAGLGSNSWLGQILVPSKISARGKVLGKGQQHDLFKSVASFSCK